MSEYFFVVDTGNAPIYQLSEELCDAAPTNVFTLQQLGKLRLEHYDYNFAL